VKLAVAALRFWTIAIYLFMLAPVLVVVVLSFNPAELATFPMTGFTLAWFARLAMDAQVIGALKTSLLLGSIAAAISTFLGTAAAYATARFRFAGRELVQLLLTLPILVPHIILGVGLLLTFRMLGLLKSFPLLVVGHVAITLPYVVLTTRHRLLSIPPVLEEAAATLGANPLAKFRRVTLPLALPAILAGALFAFMMSFDEVTATLFWRPPNTETIPTQVMAMLQYSIDQRINALAAILIALSVSLPLLAILLVRNLRQP
jgi:spermidine/putrescine transport system permease protein